MHIVRTFVLHEIYILKKIIMKDFGNLVEVTAGYIEVLFQKHNICRPK